MASITCTTRIKAPPERVFATFADLRAAAGRIKSIKKLEVLTDGPVGKGTKFRETRGMFGREQTETMEITSFDPPHSYVVEANSCGMHCVSRISFRPDGDATVAEMSFNTTPMTFFAKLMSPVARIMSKACKKMVEKDLEDLRSWLETAGAR